MISNNNFYGKKHGKTIRDFTADLDYNLDNAQDRINFLNSRLEISKVGDIEFAHDYFVELFDQTFDVVLDKDGIYWVEEEGKYMNCSEFTSWVNKNNININKYLDIQTAFDEIEYEDGAVDKGLWNYSNINTSSVKLILNSTDAQYSESNIASELTRLADYILAKDKKDKKEKIKIYSEEDFKKRLYTEKNKLEPLEQVNGDEFIILKKTENYRLAPKMSISNSDFKLPIIYRGTYEDYLDHWKTHQYKKVYLNGEYKKVYLDKNELNQVAVSECMTKEQWEKGKSNIIEKIEVLETAEKNRQFLNNLKTGSIGGNGLNGVPLRTVTKNIRDINEYMIMAKTSYHNYVCIKPDKCPVNSNIMDLVDYTNVKQMVELLSYQGSKSDLDNNISIILYDIDKALKIASRANLIDKNDVELIKLLRQGKSKIWVANKKNISRMTLYRKLEKIAVAVIGVLQGKK